MTGLNGASLPAPSLVEGRRTVTVGWAGLIMPVSSSRTRCWFCASEHSVFSHMASVPLSSIWYSLSANSLRLQPLRAALAYTDRRQAEPRRRRRLHCGLRRVQVPAGIDHRMLADMRLITVH